jgi:acetyltransferase-like isoleucine patch superfamily enzyme
MTLRARLMVLFPALHATAIFAAIVMFVLLRTGWSLASIPLAAYALPLVTFHLHQRLCPIQVGTHSIVQGYSPWFGTHMIQQGFIAMPFLESLLRLFPGVFSVWLRLWGARIGKNVYFAPGFEIADRSLLEIGNGVIFGYGVKMSSHYITPSRQYGGMKVYIRGLRFEERCFVGASSRFGPGVEVRAGAFVRADTDHYPDTVVEARPRETSPPDQPPAESAAG